MKIAEVAVNIPLRSGLNTLNYIVPEKYNSLQLGSRVKVPVGRNIRFGYVTKFFSESYITELKEIKEVLDIEAPISQEMVELASWVSNYYFSSLYKVLEYMIPPFARKKKKKMVRLLASFEEMNNSLLCLDELIHKIIKDLSLKPRRLDYLINKYGKASVQIINDLTAKKIVEEFYDFINLGKEKSILQIEALEIANYEKLLVRAPKQLEIMKILLKKGPLSLKMLNDEIPSSSAAVAALENKGMVKKYAAREQRVPFLNEEFDKKADYSLNMLQKKAVEKINNQIDLGEEGSFLIHGVTGSGKTEVYLQCIKHCLQKGRGAIILVPEISLTPQMIGRFRANLGEDIAVLHSGLSQGERYDEWDKIRSGKVRVVIGVRSAVFAPVQNLGLIVMDEEHENTYKQGDPEPRYQARDVALRRMQINLGVLILGSATPSVESYYKAQTGKYSLLELPQRATRHKLPTIEVVDMRDELKKGNKSIFSEKLYNSISTALAKEEQIILFLNRRGYATFVFCRQCGTPLQCRNCSISMTYHANPGIMKCHYCDLTMPVPNRCPKCGSAFIKFFGLGTQQVEEEVKRVWPQARITRMDVDTTRRKNSHQDLLAQFSRGETNILLGTQMIAKGLDFPNVTMVGVIAADTSLNIPDYSAGEKTFQLLTQVAGRAGRGTKEGRVIIQTYNPEHYAVTAGKSQNYKDFYKQEIKMRKSLNYPPFSFLLRILVSSLNKALAENTTKKLASQFKDCSNEYEVFGPAPAPLEKVKGRYRWHILLKGCNLNILRETSKQAFFEVLKGDNNESRVIIDIEPISIL